MISRTLLAVAVVAMSFGSANAVTYYNDQGAQSDGTAVAADRSDLDAAFDGDSSTFYSLGIGGTLSVDVSPNRIASGSVVEITNDSPNKSFPESAQIWLGGSIGEDGIWDSTDAVYFGELFNDGSDADFVADFGSIFLSDQAGKETVWELTLNSDVVYSLITLVDSTWENYSGEYTKLVSDGFDVGEFRVAAIPLPASVLMLMGALGGLGFVSRRRKADA